jgi:hypothetical protein
VQFCDLLGACQNCGCTGVQLSRLSLTPLFLRCHKNKDFASAQIEGWMYKAVEGARDDVSTGQDMPDVV